MNGPGGVRPLRWGELGADSRAALGGKLAGLYGHDTAEGAFESLAPDKRQALLLLVASMCRLRLWRAVRRVENVYGEGGVGLDFRASSLLGALLRRHPKFTRRFARHGDCAEGFFELGRGRAALHVLRGAEDLRLWSAHFDRHAPVGTPASAARHLWHEKLRARRPDWRAIRDALGREPV